MFRKVNRGLDVTSASHAKFRLAYARNKGYDFISIPIVHRKYDSDTLERNDTANITFKNTEFLISDDDVRNKIIGKVSEHYDMDSEDATYRKLSETNFLREIKYASYLGLNAVIFKLDACFKPNLARFVYSHLFTNSDKSQILMWARIPMIAPKPLSHSHQSSHSTDTWHWWNNFRQMCYSDICLGLALEVTPDLPSNEEIMRWFGEPLEVIIVPTSLFLNDTNSFPILPPAHQDFIKKCAAFKLKLIVTGNCRHSSIDLYINHLDTIYRAASTENSDKLITNHGELQITLPLQPLAQNLDTYSYEQFEKDPIKYKQYESAIYHALIDRVPEDEASSNIQIVMIVGAGRGPLVKAALNSASRSGRQIKCYAIEKNPCALMTLFFLKEETWGDKVEVIGCDMRFWDTEEKCDILVSELLGSFGDNELSPECLYGAQKLMKDDGISIPCQYTSYLCPTQSSKIWNHISPINSYNKPPTAKYETPYIVPQQIAYTIAEIVPVFTFHHPNKDPVIDNTRYAILNFKVKQDSILHGFTGYFEAVLYKEIKVGIVPNRTANGMYSWSPIFFPIKNPLSLKKGDELQLHFWRLSNVTSVWYEWSIAKPTITSIHNSNGQCYDIGLC